MGAVAVVDDLKERIAKLEFKTDDHSKSIEKLNTKSDDLVEMKTLLRMQTEINSETKDQMKEFGVTLNKVNENLTNLNINQQQMKVDMSEIGSRVSDIEKNQEKTKIDTNQLFKGILKHLGTATLSILVAYILYKFGITKIH